MVRYDEVVMKYDEARVCLNLDITVSDSQENGGGGGGCLQPKKTEKKTEKNQSQILNLL